MIFFLCAFGMSCVRYVCAQDPNRTSRGCGGLHNANVSLRERRPHRAHGVVHRARTAQAFLATLFCIVQVFFRVARTRWPKGYAYNNGGLHSSLLTKGGCSCPHPLPGEGRRKRKKKM